MSIWRFTLVDRDGVYTVVDDPEEWEGIEVILERDPKTHGIFAEYAIDNLTFHGPGAQLIKGEYDQYGFTSSMQLLIEFQCSDGQGYDMFYFGRLAFDEYEDECGDNCRVTIGLEDINSITQMRNNYEQKVNLYNAVGFDEATPLTNYPGLEAQVTIPARGLVQRSDALSQEAFQVNFFNEFLADWQHMQNTNFDAERGGVNIMFAANDIGNTEIGQDGTQFGLGPFYYNDGDPGLLPELLTMPTNAVNELACYASGFLVILNISGNLTFSGFGDMTVKLRITVKIGPDENNTTTVAQDQVIDGLFVSSGNVNWTAAIESFVLINPGDKFWIYYFVEVFKSQLPNGGILTQLVLTQNAGANIQLYMTSVCDETLARSAYINEAVSRTVEAITNDQIRFYSTTFGRTDSQPYAMPTDTCAGLFAITNGLNIRRKLLADNTVPGFFVTLKQLFDALNCVWNIGMSVEPDINRSGFSRLRFEDYRFFYQDDIGVIFNYATSVRRKVDVDRLYNRMIVGYNKWEAGEFTGLDEFMTQRTYRIDVNAISKELNVATDMICSPYTIEITRRQATGTQDYAYDNDLFGFCMIREVGVLEVETFADSVSLATNVNDSDSAYNARITPARNAMRWFAVMTQGYRNFTNATKLIFSSGTGNYIARIKLNNCNIDAGPLSENENLEIGDFQNQADGLPIMFPEILTFDHPMNYNLFKRLKDDQVLRYRSIVVKCNDAEYEAWFKSIRYRPEEGVATIEAYPKNTTQLPEPTICIASIVEGSIEVTGINYTTQEITVDFTEGNPGATEWHYFIYVGTEPSGSGQGGIATSHPFTIQGIGPGTYFIVIVPYCSEDQISNTYTDQVINIPAPPLNIRLTATAIPACGGQCKVYRITATPVGAATFAANFSFRFGQCMTAGSSTLCNGYPSAPFNPGMYATVNGVAGQTSAFADSIANTVPSGTLVSVTLHALSGITAGQITESQTWTLNFE